VRIGAHVRRRGAGAAGAVQECRLRGADGAQVFVSNPRGWAGPEILPEDAAAFRATWVASGLRPLAAHAPYLVNIASPDASFLTRSRELAAATARACDDLGVDLLVLHAGSGRGAEPAAALERAAGSLRAVAEHADRARIVVELMAGTSGAVASTVGEAARLFDAADLPGLGLCLDTCHLFAAGYALDGRAGVDELIGELRATGLDGRLALVHANDSAFPRDEHRDRHADLGDGHIGLEGWRAIVERPELAGVPFILETPGDAERQARDIAMLRSLAG
jgi:deoxyribonuclease-4